MILLNHVTALILVVGIGVLVLWRSGISIRVLRARVSLISSTSIYWTHVLLCTLSGIDLYHLHVAKKKLTPDVFDSKTGL